MGAPLIALLALGLQTGAPVQPAPMRCVIFGGGPSKYNNQIAIESNVKYVANLLPSNSINSIFFADGKKETATVQYEKVANEVQRTIKSSLGDVPPTRDPFISYRATELQKVDGASNRESARNVFDQLVTESAQSPLLLYFTGHGSPGKNPETKKDDYENNTFGMWADRGLSTVFLAKQIQKLPKQRPITLVMVQCFSGSFANLIFNDANPAGELMDRPICGYFATVKWREAAGCTPEVNQADYKDFTSYFFAALCGKTRLGADVPPPDYNQDSKVGMDEAFAWTQINEDSIDVPIATSDIFLRRYAALQDMSEMTNTPWETIWKSGSLSQRKALDGICEKLGPTAQGKGRLTEMMKQYSVIVKPGHSNEYKLSDKATKEYYANYESLTKKFPGLRTDGKSDTATVAAAIENADKYYSSRASEYAPLLSVRQLIEASLKEHDLKEVTDARWLRLESIVRSILLEAKLRKAGNKARVAQFEKLKKLEAGNPFI